MIHNGDCLDVMASLPESSVDAIVTDPPYDLTGIGRTLQMQGERRKAPGLAKGFMGKTWDGTGIAFKPETWQAAFRVAKPGAYLLAFGGTRTVHRMTCAIEDAGWTIRDVLVWGYAQGFPKSKASLKPAWEPIVMARKPGLAAPLQIDAARIDSGPSSGGTKGSATALGLMNDDGWQGRERIIDRAMPAGRWPANIVLTDPIFDGGVEGVVGGGETASPKEARPLFRGATTGSGLGYGSTSRTDSVGSTYSDQGTYSRFFLVPKAARVEREPSPALREPSPKASYSGGAPERTDGLSSRLRTKTLRRNDHPTVKPLDLMRHLVRLVTPAGGTVLDPFLGSGTTAIACELEGFPWLGIEREAEYVAIAEARLAYVQRGMGLDAA